MAAHEVRDMYGVIETFVDPCAISEDQTIVFCDLSYAHDYNGSGDEDEYFLAYGSLPMKVYLKHYVEKEINEILKEIIPVYEQGHMSRKSNQRIFKMINC